MFETAEKSTWGGNRPWHNHDHTCHKYQSLVNATGFTYRSILNNKWEIVQKIFEVV